MLKLIIAVLSDKVGWWILAQYGGHIALYSNGWEGLQWNSMQPIGVAQYSTVGVSGMMNWREAVVA
jgi:hypothetical protein